MPRFKNVLFVGTGGGNDIFSTTLAMLSLRAAGIEWKSCSVAGVLSPFHRFDGLEPTDCPQVFSVPDRDIRRIVPCRVDRIESPMVERTVAALASAELEMRIGQIYGLSLTEGTNGLTRAFRRLAKSHDFVVLVDIGGDILFRGSETDPRVLSPMFDAMVLEAFCTSGAPGILFEAGPGTDGEIHRGSLAETLNSPTVMRFPLAPSAVDEWERLFRTYVEPVRAGRTVPKTIEAFRSTQPLLTLDYRARCHLGTRRWYATFPHKISTELNRSFYLIPPDWARRRNPYCVHSDSVLGWIGQIRQPERHVNAEFQFEYLSIRPHVWLLALPSPLFTPDQRKEMVDAAFEDMRRSNCHGVITDGPEGLVCHAP
ncbi:MAG: DUF1152 domain-containing protein [Candidatus Uhrbacteria bacterium]